LKVPYDRAHHSVLSYFRVKIDFNFIRSFIFLLKCRLTNENHLVRR
jgi:hypothetical protein